MQKKVPLKKIRANPYRNIDAYPIQRDKVEALKESYEKTGFWGNVVAREKNGYIEIAYGHHRWVALKETLKPGDDVRLLIEPLSNEQMIKIMARENMAEWGTSAEVEHETVKAAVEAYAKGDIEVDAPDEKTSEHHKRYAPSYIQGCSVHGTEHPYTAETLVSFVGYGLEKTKLILKRLETVERDYVRERNLKGLSTKQADAVVAEARKTVELVKSHMGEAETEREEATQEKEAAKIARQVSAVMARDLKDPDLSIAKAKESASEARWDHIPQPERSLPDINQFAEGTLRSHIGRFLTDRDVFTVQLQQVIEYQDDLLATRKKRLVRELNAVAKRAVTFANELS